MPNEQIVVSLGMHVIIDLVLQDGIELLEFDVVPDENADFVRGFLGMSTPLSLAIMGASAGATLPYKVNDTLEVRILSVAPSQAAPPEGVQARRDDILRKAIDQSDRTNAMIFASSFSGKWGDYDPTGFLDENPEEKNLEERHDRED